MLKTILVLGFFSIGLLAVPTVYPMDVTLESEMEVLEPLNVIVYPIDENRTEVVNSNESNREVSQEENSDKTEESSVSISAISFPFVSSLFGLFLFRREI